MIEKIGAGDRVRTGDVQLGKLSFRMSTAWTERWQGVAVRSFRAQTHPTPNPSHSQSALQKKTLSKIRLHRHPTMESRKTVSHRTQTSLTTPANNKWPNEPTFPQPPHPQSNLLTPVRVVSIINRSPTSAVADAKALRGAYSQSETIKTL